MQNSLCDSDAASARRSFLKKELAVGAAGAGIALSPRLRLFLLKARPWRKVVVV